MHTICMGTNNNGFKTGTNLDTMVKIREPNQRHSTNQVGSVGQKT